MFAIKFLCTTLPGGSVLSTLEISMDEFIDHQTGGAPQRVQHQLHHISSLHKAGRGYKFIEILNVQDARRHHHFSLQCIQQLMAAARPGSPPPHTERPGAQGVNWPV